VIAKTPGVSAWLLISRTTSVWTCDSCELIADPYAGVVVTTTTDSYGHASYAVAIPNDTAVIGTTLYSQWLIAQASSPGCSAYNLDFSNALSLTIE